MLHKRGQHQYLVKLLPANINVFKVQIHGSFHANLLGTLILCHDIPLQLVNLNLLLRLVVAAIKTLLITIERDGTNLRCDICPGSY